MSAYWPSTSSTAKSTVITARAMAARTPKVSIPLSLTDKAPRLRCGEWLRGEATHGSDERDRQLAAVVSPTLDQAGARGGDDLARYSAFRRKRVKRGKGERR